MRLNPTAVVLWFAAGGAGWLIYHTIDGALICALIAFGISFLITLLKA